MTIDQLIAELQRLKEEEGVSGNTLVVYVSTDSKGVEYYFGITTLTEVLSDNKDCLTKSLLVINER